MRCRAGFTFIEILITLAILAVLFIPVMQMFSHSLASSTFSQELITATNLAKWEMERIRNLNVTKAQLKRMGNSIYPPFKEKPFEINGAMWRIKREIVTGTDPLEVRVHVYRVGEAGSESDSSKKIKLYEDLSSDIVQEKPTVTLVTLVEDMFWEEIRPIK